MKGAGKLLWLGAGAAALGLAATGIGAYSSTRYLMKVALDRQMPAVPRLEQTRAKLCGSEKFGPFLAQMESEARRLEETPHRTVTIKSYDGQKLVGHWFPVVMPKRVIVAMHGWRSRWSSDFGLIADFWRQKGCSVLYAEQRGQGQSGGDYMGFGMIERHDCVAWCKWVSSRLRKVPLYLAGVSMGATTVLLASELDLPPNVYGIMADCGYTSAYDIWKYVAEKNLHLHYGFHGGFADSLCRRKIAMGPKDCSTIPVLSKCKIPVFFAHGTEDHFVPVEMTYENFRACASRKKMLIVPGAEHGMSYYLEKERYQQALVDFWGICQ